MIHHVLLAGSEMVLLPVLRCGFDEGGWVPLLEAAFRLWSFEAEEENVLFGHFWGEALGVFKLGGEGGEVVAYPARTLPVCGHGCDESALDARTTRRKVVD